MTAGSTSATFMMLFSSLAQQLVLIAVEADQSSRRSHSSGVLITSCGTKLDRSVLAVGYGIDACTDYWKMKNSLETLNANIASTKAAIENDAGLVDSSGADIASLANGMCTGTMAVQVSLVSQVVSDTPAGVAAFNAYLDWCKEKVEDHVTEELVLSCLGALKRDAARFTAVK